MEIIILLIVLVLAGFIIRAIFNAEWRNNAQAKIDAVKKERIFWRLVNGYEGFKFTIDAIFTIYLDHRHFATFITSNNTRTEDDTRVLKLIEGRKSFECINIINTALEKADNLVAQSLAKDDKTYTKADLKKSFETYKDERLIVPEKYDDFVGYYLRFVPDQSHFKAIDVWAARKKLEEAAGQLEWKTDEVKVDAETLFALKKSQGAIGEVIVDVLCGKEVTTGALREALTDWEHLQMLRWCIVDMVVPWHGTNLIHRFFWNIISQIAS